MANALRSLLYLVAFYTFGVFNFFLYLGTAIYKGSFFRETTPQDVLQLAVARDKFWNLSKSFAGLSHRFFELRNGKQLHYLTNNLTPNSAKCIKPLVILIHGFPDSSIVWRHLIESTSSLLDKATLVAVDLPGYGGSDDCSRYSPEEVLEALTEFIVGMREMHVDRDFVDDPNSGIDEKARGGQQVYVVGHDWGCVLAYRLAAEAPGLADRFIMSNGPLVPLALSNKDNILDSSSKIFNTFLDAPWKRLSCLRKSYDTAKPLLIQLLLFGYIFAFHLPKFMVSYLGTGGNRSFLYGAQLRAYSRNKSEYALADSMTCTFGPGEVECRTELEPVDGMVFRYSSDVRRRAQVPGDSFVEKTRYYCEGVGTQKWEKSLETIGALHNIACEDASSSVHQRRNSSASSGLFEPPFVGSLRAPATIIWGQKDLACSQRICLDGIGDYLAKESTVILLPRTGHWTPIEKESRIALGRMIEWYVDGGDADGKGDIGSVVKEVYNKATVMLRK